MSKKKRNQDKSKSIFSKRFKRKLTRLLFFSFLLGSAYTLYNPTIISHPTYRDHLYAIRTQLLGYLQLSLYPTVATPPQLQHLSSVANLLPQGSILGENDIYVEEAFHQISSQLHSLPQDHLKRIKVEFCSDVISEAVFQATTSAHP